LEIAANTIDGTLTFPFDGDVPCNVDFHAEYSRSEDGILYGVIHCIDLKTPDMTEQMDAKLIASRLIEQPFALRFHAHDGTLMIKEVKLGVASAIVDEDGDLDQLTKLFAGRYEQVEARRAVGQVSTVPSPRFVPSLPSSEGSVN
jgi:hypothetical protein